VRMGRTIFFPATWRLYKDEIKGLTGRRSDPLAAVGALRQLLSIPRVVCLTDGHQLLPVDLESEIALRTFISLEKDKECAVLTELLPGPNDLCAYGPEGRFAHELIVPFVKTSVPEASSDRQYSPSPSRHGFESEAEWVSVNLYCGSAVGDKILREAIADFVRTARASGAIERWAFIRSEQPRDHLRLQLKRTTSATIQDLLAAIRRATAAFTRDGRIWRVQLDDQVQMAEFGGPSARAIAERMSEADSDAVIRILQVESTSRISDRWRVAMAAIHRLLLDLGLSLHTRREVVHVIHAQRLREHVGKAETSRRLGALFRHERAELEMLLSGKGLSPQVKSALDDRSRVIEEQAAALRNLIADGAVEANLVSIVTSLVDVHTIRLLRSAQRLQELAIVDFLARLYESEAVRGDRRRSND
jgi:thiopeptide-type bacteriocin biosynthesis protein